MLKKGMFVLIPAAFLFLLLWMICFSLNSLKPDKTFQEKEDQAVELIKPENRWIFHDFLQAKQNCTGVCAIEKSEDGWEVKD